MALPNFGSNDLLPDGVHKANSSEMKARCVDEFPGTTTRLNIFTGLSRYQAAIGAAGIHATQWIDGSFTDRTRLDPEDVDLANFCDSVELNALPTPERTSARQLLGGRAATKPAYHCHTFLVVKFPSGHPLEASFEAGRKYWRDWFATPQDYSGAVKTPAPGRGRKGIVQMYAGDAKSCVSVDPS